MNLNFPFFKIPSYKGKFPPLRADTRPVPTVFKENPHNDTDKKMAEAGAAHTVVEESKKDKDSDFCFDVFGIKLYYDDILLISLIFFLYNEGVDDSSLFIALILLLLS